MQLTSITARYLRRKQPQQFEPAEAEVSVTFVATEGHIIPMDQAQAYYDKALGSVQAVVMAKMGGKPVEPVAVEGLKAVKVEAKVETVNKTVGGTAPGSDKPVAAPAEAPKNKGGRPRKDAVAPAKPAEAKPATDEFGDPIAPAKPAAAPAKPAAAADEFDDPVEAAVEATPGDEEFAENEVKPISPIELQQMLSGWVTGKKVAGSDVKAILQKYGATRSSDVAEGDRAAVVAEVKALIKA